ncbi:MAG: hypothetical protein WD824_16030 [Cyclobacteriaceae bacterium]
MAHVNRCLVDPELLWQYIAGLQHHFNGGFHLKFVKQFFSETFNGMKTDPISRAIFLEERPWASKSITSFSRGVTKI